MAGTTIGYAKGASVDIAVAKIEDFQLSSDKAAVLAAGNKNFKVTVDHMWIAVTYQTQILAGTPVDFVFAPAGTSGGNAKITVKNVILLTHNMTIDQKGIVGEKITGEGNDYQLSTW
jgi:hypothetical protein